MKSKFTVEVQELVTGCIAADNTEHKLRNSLVHCNPEDKSPGTMTVSHNLRHSPRRHRIEGDDWSSG